MSKFLVRLVGKQYGYLLFGTAVHNTMAITFLSPEAVNQPMLFSFAQADYVDQQPLQKRTIYFTLGDEDSYRAIWHNIVHDARRVRA